MSESQYLVIPDKFYRLTEITIWGDLWIISGLQFKYETVSEVTGYAPLLLTAGSTRYASRYQVLTTHAGTSSYIRDYVIKMNNSTDSDGGLSYIKFLTPTEFSGGTPNLEWKARTKSDINTQTVTYNRNNLIGLDLVVGASRDGTVQTIREINFVFDYQNCEEAYIESADYTSFI